MPCYDGGPSNSDNEREVGKLQQRNDELMRHICNAGRLFHDMVNKGQIELNSDNQAIYDNLMIEWRKHRKSDKDAAICKADLEVDRINKRRNKIRSLGELPSENLKSLLKMALEKLELIKNSDELDTNLY